MIRLARWHALDMCAFVPPFIACCRPIACSAPYFRSRSIRPSTHPIPSDLALYLSIARSPLLKTHSLRPARRTRQRLTSYDFIESARRSISGVCPGYISPGLPIKIWRHPAAIRTGTSTTWLHRWAMYSRMCSGPSWSGERWKYCANYTPMLSEHGCERLSHDQPIVFSRP